MLNETARLKAERLLELTQKGVKFEAMGLSVIDMTSEEVEWLALTVIEMDDRAKKHTTEEEPCKHINTMPIQSTVSSELEFIDSMYDAASVDGDPYDRPVVG